ncbi:hypothetical protein [Paraconexibacter sp.]|uniref:hypothetical protein n=1 Tax=Paraconexibacter sp. TaxID=2949640 RepID=UPI003566F1EB
MTRRVLILRQPLRRRPFGERPHSASHAERRDRMPLTAPPYAPLTTRRGAPH